MGVDLGLQKYNVCRLPITRSANTAKQCQRKQAVVALLQGAPKKEPPKKNSTSLDSR